MTLRPGFPITSSSHETCKFFLPEGIVNLAHVDLELRSSEEPCPEASPIAAASSNLPEQTEWSFSKAEQGQGAYLENWGNRMAAVTNMFNMLRERGVKRIFKVTVRDDHARPCTDRVIRRCLDGFDVRYLDWDKRDLCIDVVRAACPKIAELTLYSSGRQAVLRSWTAPSGLCGLNQVRTLLFAFPSPQYRQENKLMVAQRRSYS